MSDKDQKKQRMAAHNNNTNINNTNNNNSINNPTISHWSIANNNQNTNQHNNNQGARSAALGINDSPNNIYHSSSQPNFQGLRKIQSIPTVHNQASAGNNGIGPLTQIDSMSSSASNLSVPMKTNAANFPSTNGPGQPTQMFFHGGVHGMGGHHSGSQMIQSNNSRSSLPKSGSSPLSIYSATTGNKKSPVKLVKSKNTSSQPNNTHLQAPNINLSNYNTTKNYRDAKEHEEAVEQAKFVYKSNSYKSINWEGTPQNHTHQSINNKNTNSQSQKSLISAKKLQNQNSSRKHLMPSGSSGTLLRKEIIEMDEVNSSSSSGSIGKEKNMHLAVQTSEHIQKAKIRNKDIIIDKLNFTGKPFAPDSIFLNHTSKNMGSGEEGINESENMNGASHRLSGEVDESAEGQLPLMLLMQNSLGIGQNSHQSQLGSNSDSNMKVIQELQIQKVTNLQGTNNSSPSSSQKSIKAQYSTMKQNTQQQQQQQFTFNQQQLLSIQLMPSQKQTLKVSKKLQGPKTTQSSQQYSMQVRNASPGSKLKQKDAQPKQSVNSSGGGMVSHSPQLMLNTQYMTAGVASDNAQAAVNQKSSSKSKQSKKEGGSLTGLKLQHSANQADNSGNHTKIMDPKQQSHTQKQRVSFVEQQQQQPTITNITSTGSVNVNGSTSKAHLQPPNSQQKASNNQTHGAKGRLQETQSQSSIQTSSVKVKSGGALTHTVGEKAVLNSVGKNSMVHNSSTNSNGQTVSQFQHQQTSNNQSNQQNAYYASIVTPGKNNNTISKKSVQSVQQQNSTNNTTSKDKNSSVNSSSNYNSNLGGGNATVGTNHQQQQQVHNSNYHAVRIQPKSDQAKKQIQSSSTNNRQMLTSKTLQQQYYNQNGGSTSPKNNETSQDKGSQQQNIINKDAQSNIKKKHTMLFSKQKQDYQSEEYDLQTSEAIEDESGTLNSNRKSESTTLNFKDNQLGQRLPGELRLEFDQSPNKSNKVPSSLAFKRKSHDNGEQCQQSITSQQQQFFASTILQQQQQNSFRGLGNDSNSNRQAQSARKAILCPTVITARTHEEEHNMLSTRRQYDDSQAVGGPHHSLKFKEELNRNIPFTKFNIDFSSKQCQQKTPGKCPQLITSLYSLVTLTTYFDFENLLRLMSIIKYFREDFTQNLTLQQIYIQKIFKNQMKYLLTLGLPSTLQRIQYWNFRTKFFYGKKKKPNLYQKLKGEQSNEYVADIKKDIYRTFPYLSFFQEPQNGQEKLFNILNALAQQNTKTGYIQGMNFLAGTLLINLHKEEETFWMMMSILNKYKFDSILDLKNGGLFQILCYQLEMLMQVHLPELADHLSQMRIPTDIYAANWFITMFCYDLSIDLVLCIMDVFLLEGKKSLIRVSLALLSFMQERILLMEYEECMEYLSHSAKDINVDSQTLIETAFSFKVTNSLLLDLELLYRLKHKSQNKILKAFNRLALQEEIMPFAYNNERSKFTPPLQLLQKVKLHWIILPATPDDIHELITRNKEIREEDIQMFYQDNLKQRKVREVVEELQIEEDSEIAKVNNYVMSGGKKDALSNSVNANSNSTMNNIGGSSSSKQNNTSANQILGNNSNSSLIVTSSLALAQYGSGNQTSSASQKRKPTFQQDSNSTSGVKKHGNGGGGVTSLKKSNQQPMTTMQSRYNQSAIQHPHHPSNQQAKKRLMTIHFNTDSNNTIQELTNDFSGGGYSNIGNNPRLNNTNLNNIKMRSKINSKSQINSLNSQGETGSNNNKVVLHQSAITVGKDENHNSSQGGNTHTNKNNLSHNHMLTIVLQEESPKEVMKTPQKNHKSTELQQSGKKKGDGDKNLNEERSPFVQIGSKIKNYFGNFFKTQEKLNKSYEEPPQESEKDISLKLANNNQDPLASTQSQGFLQLGIKKAARSKSIHHKEGMMSLQQNSRIRNINHDSPSNVLMTVDGTDNNDLVIDDSPYLTKTKFKRPNTLKDRLQVTITTEDCHNIPNNNLLFFNTTTHQQLAKKTNNKIGGGNYFMGSKNGGGSSSGGANSGKAKNSLMNTMDAKGLKQVCASVEQTQTYGEDDDEDDCELDLLSDYAIAPVGENVLKSNSHHRATGDAILIAKDLVAGEGDADADADDDDVEENGQIHQGEDIMMHHMNFNQSKLFQQGLPHSVAVSSDYTLQSNKIDPAMASSGISNSHALSLSQGKKKTSNSKNIQQQQPRLWGSGASTNTAGNIFKQMKSSPPISPKDSMAILGGNLQIQAQTSSNNNSSLKNGNAKVSLTLQQQTPQAKKKQ